MRAGWEIKKLKELGETQTGTTPPTREKGNYGNFIPFVKPAHFNEDGSIQLDELGLSELGLKKGRLIEKNSILMVCIGATIGKTGLVTVPVSCNQQINSFTPKKGLYARFFYYALKRDDFLRTVLNEASQATLPIINKSKWENLNVSYPKSFEEQKQIVAILDRAFAAIDQAKANVEKNLQNAKALFQSKLNEIFSQQGEGWEEKKLGNLSFVKSGGTPLRSKKEYWDHGNISWYSSGELNNLYTTQSERFITAKGLENSNAKLFPKGSLLIGMYDTAALKMSILDRDATFNQAIAGVEPKENLHLTFVFHAINAKKPQLLNERRGVRQKNLSLRKIKDIKVPLPNINLQYKIVDDLNRLNKSIHNAQKSYQSKIIFLEQLKKSILQKAFAGELTSSEGAAYQKDGGSLSVLNRQR